MSSYNEPLPVGSPQGTGAYAISVGNTAAGTNNVGNRTDSAGNVAPDFVWGNFPMQPNDERTDGTAVVAVANDASGNYDWSGHTVYPSARLTAATSNNHTVAEAEWNNYPAFTPGVGNYKVTAASGNGTTVTYTSQNSLTAGDSVNITGLTASAYNLSAATVATADKLKFTVTNAANAGEITGQWYGKVEATNALTAYDGAGITFINVPSVVGETLALALDELKDAGYEAANITTATAATNAVSTITAVARTGTTATITSTGAGAKYPVGTKITVASLAAPDTALNGTFTVTAVATNTVSYTTTTSGTLSTGSLSVAGLSGVEGTIKSQTVAAGTASVLSTATISITPFAVLS
jgi:hypothetical protein